MSKIFYYEKKDVFFFKVRKDALNKNRKSGAFNVEHDYNNINA